MTPWCSLPSWHPCPAPRAGQCDGPRPFVLVMCMSTPHGRKLYASPQCRGASWACQRCGCMTVYLRGVPATAWPWSLPARVAPPSHHLGCRTDRRRPCADAGRRVTAHNGVLFLDELSEFGRYVLEVSRQPLEEGVLCTRSREHTRSGPVDDARGTGHAGDNRHGHVRVGPYLPQRAYGASRVVSPRCVARFRRERLTTPSTRMPRTISSPHDSLPGSPRAPGSLLMFA
jgi:hypothetical protein